MILQTEDNIRSKLGHASSDLVKPNVIKQQYPFRLALDKDLPCWSISVQSPPITLYSSIYSVQPDTLLSYFSTITLLQLKQNAIPIKAAAVTTTTAMLKIDTGCELSPQSQLFSYGFDRSLLSYCLRHAYYLSFGKLNYQALSFFYEKFHLILCCKLYLGIFRRECFGVMVLRLMSLVSFLIISYQFIIQSNELGQNISQYKRKSIELKNHSFIFLNILILIKNQCASNLVLSIYYLVMRSISYCCKKSFFDCSLSCFGVQFLVSASFQLIKTRSVRYMRSSQSLCLKLVSWELAGFNLSRFQIKLCFTKGECFFWVSELQFISYDQSSVRNLMLLRYFCFQICPSCSIKQ